MNGHIIDTKPVDERCHLIYMYISPSNKIYIGQTTGEGMKDVKRRAGGGGKGYKDCPYFWNAIQKYGWESFRCEIIISGLTQKEVDEAERFYIEGLESYKPQYGYNISHGGFGGRYMGKNAYSKEYQREYYLAHKEQLNADSRRASKIWYQENKDKIHQQYVENKEKMQSYNKTYYENNKEKLKESSRAYYYKVKDDPEFKEKRRQQNKEYRKRKKIIQ